jgi:hypothetical protein
VIYICIPSLNEAPTVGVLLWKLRQVMSEFGRDYQVLVLDDGSSDDTQDVLSPYGRVMPLTVLRNERTQGYPAAVERLLREAVARSTHPKRDTAVVLQADFTESPADVPALVRRIEGGADVVGGVPAPSDAAPRSHRWLRRGISWLLSRSAAPREIRDPASGFRAYRIAVLKRTLTELDGRPLLTGSGWAANVQLLLAVAPHARRADTTDVGTRVAHPARVSRMRAWGTAMDLWRVARSAPRRGTQPVAAEVPEPPLAAPEAAERPAGRRGGRRRNSRKKQEGEAA